MVRVLIAVVAALALLTAACNRDATPTSVSVAGPETLVTLPSCDSLADTTVDLLQAYLDRVAGMTIDELLDPHASAAQLEPLDAASAALTARAAELGCTSEDLTEFVADKVDDLRAEGPLAERYLAIVLERVGVTPEG